MANVDIELELWVLRANVSGIRQDVREVKTCVTSLGHDTALQCADMTEQRARCDQLRVQIERIDEALAALELRCSR
jgi:hypothetical protein